MEFFRFCPGCGRRFHVKLLGKQLVHMERHERRRIVALGSRGITPSAPITLVYEDAPIIVDVENFQYNYRCKHCGHQWSDNRVEEHEED